MDGRHPSQQAYGTGNVFRDLGLPNPDVLLVKADIVSSIRNIQERGLTIEQAADAVEMEADKLRGIVERGLVDGFSVEALDRVVEALEAHGIGRKL